MPSKHCCATCNVFMELTVTYSPATYMICSVVLPVQYWLWQCTTMLYVHCLVPSSTCTFTLGSELFTSSHTQRWWNHCTAQVNSLSKTNSKQWRTSPSYWKNANTLQLDSHQHTIMDTISIIHKLFLDKWKGMGKCRVSYLYLTPFHLHYLDFK
jgi:hypothetical protein